MDGYARSEAMVKQISLQIMGKLYCFHETSSLVSRLHESSVPGQCYVAANKVTTFDGVVIAIPAAAAACEAVVAKDCSAQAAFAVTATPVDANMMMKAVKVIAPGAMFEVMPHAAGAVVAVNGIRRVIPAAAPITFTAG